MYHHSNGQEKYNLPFMCRRYSGKTICTSGEIHWMQCKSHE